MSEIGVITLPSHWQGGRKDLYAGAYMGQTITGDRLERQSQTVVTLITIILQLQGTTRPIGVRNRPVT